MRRWLQTFLVACNCLSFVGCATVRAPGAPTTFVDLNIESRPSGADVYAVPRGTQSLGQKLGTTPCTLRVGVANAVVAEPIFGDAPQWGQLWFWGPANAVAVEGVRRERPDGPFREFNVRLSFAVMKDGYSTFRSDSIIGTVRLRMKYECGPGASADTPDVVASVGTLTASLATTAPQPPEVPPPLPQDPTPRASKQRPPCAISDLPKVANRISIAVLDFQVAEGLRPEEGAVLADLCRQFILQCEQFILVDREAMRELLAEEDLAQVMSCDNTQCLVDYGRKLRAQKIAYGKLNRLGGSLTLTIKLVDVGSGAVNAIASERTTTGVEDLADLVDGMTCTLLKATLQRLGE